MIDEDEAAFHRAIMDRPDDPMYFRVYADWLEERGQLERAMLMRSVPIFRVHAESRSRPIVCINAGRLRYQIALRRSGWTGFRFLDPDIVALIDEYEEDIERRRFLVHADGSTDANDEWWGWLLALALARGRKMSAAEPS